MDPNRYAIVGCILTLSLAGCSGAAAYVPAKVVPPPIVREFRGTWIASVANIDWPSTNTLSVGQQKEELINLLTQAAELHLNAVILQVRPACDALYSSKLEPWSEYLTGVAGRAPTPFYDPLALAVAEAHKRGLELHAWFNPYRARHPSAKTEAPKNHISISRRELVRTYGRQLWLDPGEKAVQDHSAAVVLDVVSRYDIDGVHFDDYFYPYKERDDSGKEIDFPDDASWKKFGVQTGLSRDDWRRQNVDVFVQRVHKAVNQAKPWVKFGVSPFGIWRPGNPSQIQGFDAYGKLYADARKWLMNGWVDYFTPQLYWAIDPPAQSFPVLLSWWREQNAKQRHLWPGLNTYNVGRTWKPEEIVRQIQLTREEKGDDGHVHWNTRRGVLAPNGLGQILSQRVYSQPALVPASPWLSRVSPAKPKVSLAYRGAGVKISCASGNENKVWQWVVQSRHSGKWRTKIVPGDRAQIELGSRPEQVAVTAVNRYGNASAPSTFQQAPRAGAADGRTR